MPEVNPQRFREARNRKLLTKKEAANLAGLAPWTVGRIEGGVVSSPQPATIKALARVYGIDPRSLLKDGGETLENEVVAKTA